MVKDRKQINKIAKSIFNGAVKEKAVEKISEDFDFMAELLQYSPDTLHFFNDIFQSEKRHQDILITIAKKASFHDLTTKYLLHILSIRHMDWVVWIADYYRRLADDHLGRERAMVSTPFALVKKDKKALVNKLEDITGKKILLSEDIDTTLIAGISVKIGSMIFDGSLANQLRRIEKEISNAS